MSFKNSYSLKERKEESNKIKEKYPDRIPIIFEHKNSKEDKEIKRKYLVPLNLTVGEFIYVVRKRINIKQEQAIYLFINNKSVTSGMLLSLYYQNHKDPDGFLYINWTIENTFG